jgi:3-oxoacyl-[acyl-carrier protein] reductase
MAEGGHWEHVSKTNLFQVDDFLRHHQAIGRFGTPDEISPFVLFMASNLAKFAPASIVPVDGGSM